MANGHASVPSDPQKPGFERLTSVECWHGGIELEKDILGHITSEFIVSQQTVDAIEHCSIIATHQGFKGLVVASTCLPRQDVISRLVTAAEPPRALVSTRNFSDGFAALQAFRPSWHIEDDIYP